MKTVFFLCFSLIIRFSADGQDAASAIAIPSSLSVIDSYACAYYSQCFGFRVDRIENAALYDFVIEWLGISYKYSGKDTNGIDCSALVNNLYQQVYGITLKRTAADIYSQVKHLRKEKLEEGDLVFFKIKRKRISHVGVYLGNGKFVHASLSNGVIISDLNDEYYRKYFVKGGRIG